MHGKELILDIHNCMINDLISFCQKLCGLIELEYEDFIVCSTDGVSTIQFVKAGSIAIHVLPLLKQVYINIFLCKEFDVDIAAKFCETYFHGIVVNRKLIERV